jgi:hypothetical protein
VASIRESVYWQRNSFIIDASISILFVPSKDENISFVTSCEP